MTIKHLTPTLFGLMLSGGLIAASATAQPTIALDRDLQVQYSVELPTATTQQLEQVSGFLLQLVYCGLPSALIVAVLLHNKRKEQQTQAVPQLVRIRDKK